MRLAREGRPAAAPPPDGGHLKLGLGEQQMVWPVENELWNDEAPMPALVSRCVAADAPQGTPGGPDALAAPAVLPAESEITLVSSAAGQLPPEHPARPLLLVQAAVLSISRGEARAAAAPLARLDQMAQPKLTPDERERVVLANALAAIADPAIKPDPLLAKGRAALGMKTSAPARRALSLLLAQRLIAAGRTDDAVAVLGPPPHGDDEVGRYIAFKQMEAHARAGRLAALLAEAREVLGAALARRRRERSGVDRDHGHRAADVAGIAGLRRDAGGARVAGAAARAPGPGRRVRAGGAGGRRVPFRHGDVPVAVRQRQRSESAAAEPGPRVGRRRTRRRSPGVRAHLPHARRAGRSPRGRRRQEDGVERQQEGRQEGRPRGAGRQDRQATRPARSSAPIGIGDRADRGPKLELQARDGALIASAESEKVREKRRAARSVNWQRALLVVARDALPGLVENDDQPNLATLVDTLKRHLVDGGRGPVDEELTTLYRAASAHLKAGARAYAETVGAERRPILLGDVLIGRKYNVPAPQIDLSSALDEIGPMVFVPRRGNDASTASLQRWPGRLGVAWTGSRS